MSHYTYGPKLNKGVWEHVPLGILKVLRGAFRYNILFAFLMY